MKRTFLSGIGLLLAFGLSAQDPVAQQYGALITTSDLKENLSILASDAMEGRETGKRGQKMAAAFISAYFEDLGLTPPVNGTYQQAVNLFMTGAPTVSVTSVATELKEYEDYAFYGSGQTEGIKQATLIFAGKGTDEELALLDVKDKAVAFFLDENASLRNIPAVAKLREKGAAAIVAITAKQEEFTTLTGMLKRFASGRITLSDKPAANLGVFIVGPNSCLKFFNASAEKLTKAVTEKKLGKVKAGTVSYSVKQTFTPIKSSNVLGYLEGSDKKDELLVISSHYDHIGMLPAGTPGDRINNGADDDGSGTVAIMQLAKAFMQAKKDGKGPRRSILFLAVTGEEKGLLGSDFYTQYPVFPLDKTVVNLNIDMIGRRDPQHKDSAPYVYVIGSDRLSNELHTLSESINNTYTKLEFDYTYNAESHPDRIYYRSDHWNFAKNNIPIIFYFDGVHEDYHKPSDEVDKIEFDLLEQRAKLVFYTAWDIANRDNRVVADKGTK